MLTSISLALSILRHEAKAANWRATANFRQRYATDHPRHGKPCLFLHISSPCASLVIYTLMETSWFYPRRSWSSLLPHVHMCCCRCQSCHLIVITSEGKTTTSQWLKKLPRPDHSSQATQTRFRPPSDIGKRPIEWLRALGRDLSSRIGLT